MGARQKGSASCVDCVHNDSSLGPRPASEGYGTANEARGVRGSSAHLPWSARSLTGAPAVHERQAPHAKKEPGRSS